MVAGREVDRVHDERARSRRRGASRCRRPRRAPSGSSRRRSSAASTIAPTASASPTNRSATSSSFRPTAVRRVRSRPATWNASAPNFSPDGKWVAFSSLRIEGRRVRVPEVAHLRGEPRDRRDQADLESQRDEQRPGVSRPTESSSRSSPPIRSNHSAWAESKLYVMNADGSNTHVVSGNIDRPISGVMWTNDGNLLLQRRERGVEEPLRHEHGGSDPAGDERQAPADGDGGGQERARGGHALDADRSLTTSSRSPSRRPERSRRSTSSPRSTTTCSPARSSRRRKRCGTRRRTGSRSRAGSSSRPDFDASKKYPLILDIHGGPQAMYNVAFNFSRQDHAANGYVVLYTNPRGSTGYGEKFAQRDQERVSRQGLR